MIPLSFQRRVQAVVMAKVNPAHDPMSNNVHPIDGSEPDGDGHAKALGIAKNPLPAQASAKATANRGRGTRRTS